MKKVVETKSKKPPKAYMPPGLKNPKRKGYKPVPGKPVGGRPGRGRRPVKPGS